MKGYFDKHIRNRFTGDKTNHPPGLFGRKRTGFFPPRPIPRRRMPHPQRVEIMPCRRMRETQRSSIVPRLQYILTRHISGLSFDEIRKTRRVGLFHGCGMHKPRCVFMSLCRGVLHTPYKRPIYGANDPNDRLSMRILVPCGAILWGVCHTPLPCYPKNDCGRGMFCRVT